VWIGTVILLSVPYAVTAAYIPAKKMGVYVGLMNCFITVGEQAAVGVGYVAAVAAGSLPEKWNIKENRANIGAGMFSGFIGFVMSLFLITGNESDPERELKSAVDGYQSLT
jgi:hypothetical protein